jgi:SAM-dependent methyltransferase
MRPRPSSAADPYSRVDYRRMIAWPERIEREWPFIERVLASGPSRRILDLGSGTGEHARFLAAHGFEVVGIDASESMLAKATEEPLPDSLRFVRGDLAEVDSLVEGDFGGALCLGNTLPHLAEEDHLARAFRAARARLLRGAPLLLQIVNYDRVFASRQRHLPLNFRPGDAPGEEIVFLRLMDPRPDGTVVFNPTTLRYRPGQEPPVEVVSTRNVLLRGWKREEVERLLAEASFADRELYGGMREEPYLADASPDLVVVAR